MASALTIKWEGVETAAKKLGTLADDRARRRVTQASVRAGVKPLMLEARRGAPKDTGALRKQLKSSTRRSKERGSIVGRVRAKRTKAQARKDVPQANRYLHLVTGGAAPHVIPNAVIGGRFVGTVSHPGMQPNDFIQEAADKTAKQAVDAFGQKFSEKMLQEMTKIQGKT